MTIDKIPYFMTNKEWYYHDEEEWRYKLTDKAPRKARRSYARFYKMLDDSVGVDLAPNKETLKAIAEVEAMKKDPTLGKSYTDVGEMFKDLLSH